ncbi:brassinosteroid-related acyltransferase 1 isoform X3 [Pistacia vera]|uniref:brassinosteroid-related acyltransferase 1 isoform X1 n=1 Tax=Pistacia vera TaxID=55513 RepID=UPI001262C9ED|nr:brassinosteroid-related acyltransferase 1 isoform X1 [Pistacia vera]XP_031279698.1 brassinosteroid-related acyltransferase 1 isoform X2 [Pistacia vera]XP_031279699.1 brassinosteroid-related acyltransferase 1 isoform X3 [Pistacia vera]
MATQKNGNFPTVCVTKSLSVHPKSLQPQQILSLSNLDRQCPLLMYLVFFYKPTSVYQNLSLDLVFSKLKSGLEETLSVWYPAAGRLSLNPNDGKLNIWCNNKGAILVEAVTQVKISELGDLSQYNEFLEKLVYKPVFNGNFAEMPLVVAQVTRFGCGGYSVGIGTSHSLFDGPGSYDFLRAWASNSAIMKDKGGIEVHKPVHERGRMRMTNSHVAKSAMAPRAAAIDHLYMLIKNALGAGQNLSEMGNMNYVTKTFHLSGAMIESFKRKIFGQGRGNFSCSSFELVAAHLWKARTKAVGVKKEAIVCLQFAVDTRNKMVPPLPKGFSGNAFVLASVALTAGELEQGSHEAIVEKIKKAKNSINNDYVNAYNEALEGPQGTLPPLKELTLVSDWTRMPFHKVDFVHGEAGAASPLISPIPQVAYFMQNPTDVKGIDLRIGLLPQTVNAFSHYFLNNLH